MALLLGLFGCEEPADDAQEYLFEHEYVNWAWGYNHWGWHINARGEVHAYTYAPGDTFWDPASWSRPTLAELTEKYGHARERVLTVDADTLRAKRRLIDAAAAGSYSDSLNILADAGTSAYICYRYDADEERYQRIVLTQWGDWQYENTSPSARELVSWLKTLFDKIE